VATQGHRWRGGCCDCSGRRAGRAGVAGDGAVPGPVERGDDGRPRCPHVPQSSRAAGWPLPSPVPPPRRCARGRPFAPGRGPLCGTRGGPTAGWCWDQGWSPPQDKGLGPRWSHGADFPCETRDHAGTTALVLAPRVVPRKRPVWSHKTGVWSQGRTTDSASWSQGGTAKMCPVVPGVAACGTMTARRVAPRGGPS